MKHIKTNFLLAAVAVCCISLLGCKNTTSEAPAEPVASVEEETSYLQAIDNYLINEIGSCYAEAQYCIPEYSVVAVDESNDTNILVWGDYWVSNYNLVGDTLKFISGGSHPGLFHLRHTTTGYEITCFEEVADGSGNLESAKRIFGSNYEAFHAINSDKEYRERQRALSIGDYVKVHSINANFHQDYGWTANAIG